MSSSRHLATKFKKQHYLSLLTKPRNILASSTAIFLYTAISRTSIYCQSLSISTTTGSTSSSSSNPAAIPIPNSNINNQKNTNQLLYCSPSTNDIIEGEEYSAMENIKTTEELQSQWAGGRDVWKGVPIISSSSTVNIQTKIQEEGTISSTKIKSTTSASASTNRNPWPEVVTSSILYGFGAYNPRGQTVPDEINKKQHLALENDIKDGIMKLKTEIEALYKDKYGSGESKAFWWQGASLWEDGSSERGFIVAFPLDDKNENENLDVQAQVQQRQHEFIIELAKKYDQGAVYKFEFIDGRLMRDTVAVLDVGTDASVEVVQDVDAIVDLTLFE